MALINVAAVSDSLAQCLFQIANTVEDAQDINAAAEGTIEDEIASERPRHGVHANIGETRIGRFPFSAQAGKCREAFKRLGGHFQKAFRRFKFILGNKIKKLVEVLLYSGFFEDQRFHFFRRA